MSISLKLRILLQDESVASLTIKVFEKARTRNKFNFYPNRVNSCLNSAFSNQPLWEENQCDYQESINRCFNLPENEYIELLIKSRIITGKYEFDADGANMTLSVNKINPGQFNEIVNWVKDRKYIINSGAFSLDTLSGNAYFEDHKTPLKPGTGYYMLFKEFLTTDKKYLSFSEIIEIQKKTLPSDEKIIKEEAINHIKHLKKILNMRGGKGKLLTMFERKGYALQSK